MNLTRSCKFFSLHFINYICSNFKTNMAKKHDTVQITKTAKTCCRMFVFFLTKGRIFKSKNLNLFSSSAALFGPFKMMQQSEKI